jgi:adenine deaminase
LGFDPVAAIRMATLNVAEHFALDRAIGGIAPGRYADILIIPELRKIDAELVISNGKVIARNGELLVSPRSHAYSEASLNTVRVPRKLSSADFFIHAGEAASPARVRVIDQVTDLVTRELQVEVSASGGKIRSDVSHDIVKVAAIDRANNQGKLFVGLVRGFGIKSGAFASTGAWDTSDIVVVGVSGEDMAGAVNRVLDLQGGIAVYADGMVQAELPLEIWGLVSSQPMEFVAAKLKEIERRLNDLGCLLANPLLTLTTLTCAAIPHLRICEEGLVRIRDGKRENLVVK